MSASGGPPTASAPHAPLLCVRRCVPSSSDLWLALAKLETYENAQRVLNQARQAVPTEPDIWIAASKLEEARGKHDMVAKIIPRALKALNAQQVRMGKRAGATVASASCDAFAPLTGGHQPRVVA